MKDDIAQVLITPDALARRVGEMGAEIARSADYHNGNLIIVTILSGAIIFLADLIRQLPMKMRIGLITVSSYRGATTKSLGPELLRCLDEGVTDRHVLVVDDILDTGNTLRLVQNLVREQRPRSLKTAVLLRKPGKAPPDVPVDYIGFDIEDEFVVGYGLDYNNLYRNLPYIAVLKPELY